MRAVEGARGDFARRSRAAASLGAAVHLGAVIAVVVGQRSSIRYIVEHVSSCS